MASSMIHIAITNELNKKLKRNSKELLIGTIAPDISKLIGENKVRSHFLDSDKTDIPNLEKFLDKYKANLDNDFVLGYYLHLYVDYLWFNYFMPEVYHKNLITKMDGTIVKCNGKMISQYIYNDYTNLNIKLIDEYNLDLEIFYEEIPKFDNIIEEIPYDKIKLIVDKAGLIIKNSKEHKSFVFDMQNINQFIKTSLELIEANLKELNLL